MTVTFLHVYLSMYNYMYVFMYVCMYTCLYTYGSMYILLCICMYVCVYTYMYVCTSLYLYDLNHHHVCHVNENQNGITALMYASIEGHKDIAKLLTDKGADLNLQNNVSVPFYV